MSRHRHAAPWALGIALSLAGCAAGNLPPVNSDADRLAQAHHQYQRGNYSMAIPLLSSYVTTAVGSAAVDEALYLLGDCYVRTKDYPSAAIELERLLRDYPESDSAAAAALRLGDAYWGQARPSDFDQAQTLKALEQWQSYLRDYPGHWAHDVARRHVAQARGRLADKALHTGNLYIKLRKLAPARVYFERVVEEFPETTQAAEAIFGLARVSEMEGELTKALYQLDRLLAEYPTSSAAARAVHDRARIQAKLGHPAAPPGG